MWWVLTGCRGGDWERIKNRVDDVQSYDGSLFIPIRLKTGVEEDVVVRDALRQLRRVADRLLDRHQVRRIADGRTIRNRADRKRIEARFDGARVDDNGVLQIPIRLTIGVERGRVVSDAIEQMRRCRAGELDGYRSILSGEDPDKPFRLPGVR